MKIHSEKLTQMRRSLHQVKVYLQINTPCPVPGHSCVEGIGTPPEPHTTPQSKPSVESGWVPGVIKYYFKPWTLLFFKDVV